MINIIIDGKELRAKPGLTILQACASIGITIPRFCYHERLSIAGNCRMCLVEIAKSPKPVASCALQIDNGMIIKTNSDLVKKAREGVMELLLANHPLDCPICDQGGECDLQDQTMVYGSDRGRFKEDKRVVEDKNLGPFIKTIMTRCIHCTRCIRFASEIAGVPLLGLTGRGGSMEVGTYVEKTLDSELSGNVIDLCPVGALTSKPFAFTARNWELRSVNSIDVTDPMGSNIRIDHRGGKVFRIIPRLNEEINEEWITDKIRFLYDSFYKQRLNKPLIRSSRRGETSEATGAKRLYNRCLAPTNWQNAFEVITTKLKGIPGASEAQLIDFKIGPLVEVEQLLVFKDLLTKLGVSIKGSIVNSLDFRSDFTLGCGLKNASLELSTVLLIGAADIPLLNVRLKKCQGGVHNEPLASTAPSLFLIGNYRDLTQPFKHLGNGPKSIFKILQGKDPFCRLLIKENNVAILFAFNGPFVQRAIDSLKHLTYWIGKDRCPGPRRTFIVAPIHQTMSKINGSEIGLEDGRADPSSRTETRKNGSPLGPCPTQIVFNLGNEIKKNGGKEGEVAPFNIYLGHHGSGQINLADVILPGATFIEKNSTYLNIEGRTQETRLVNLPPDLAREDWKILKALSGLIDLQGNEHAPRLYKKGEGPLFGEGNEPRVTTASSGPLSLPFSSKSMLSSRGFAVSPHLLDLGRLPQQDPVLLQKPFRPLKIQLRPFKRVAYLTDPLTQNSKNLCLAATAGTFKLGMFPLVS
jgi:NADH-quinone oxidoreductase chain G